MRILVALDFSESSSLACRWAIAHARGLGATELVFNHVAERGEPSAELEELEQATRDLRRFVDAQAAGMAPLDGIEVRYAVSRGTPGEEILRAITAHCADAVVMGTNNRKGLDRLLLGSVAESIVRGAPCTVIVVKPGMGA